MHDFLMWIGGIVATGLYMVIGWMIKMIHAKIDTNSKKHDALSEKLDAHKLYAANNYITRTETNVLIDKILNKLDRIEDKLDKKMDKAND